MRLNLGCGPQVIEGWTNVDSSPEDKPDVVADVTDLPFEDNSADEIFASHILEHIHWDVPVLEEWHRVLRPGGLITIAVPDLIGTYFSWKLGQKWGHPVAFDIDLAYVNATVFGAVVLPIPYFHNPGHIHRQVFIMDMLVERMRPLFPDAHVVSGCELRDAALGETMAQGTKP